MSMLANWELSPGSRLDMVVVAVDQSEDTRETRPLRVEAVVQIIFQGLVTLLEAAKILYVFSDSDIGFGSEFGVIEATASCDMSEAEADSPVAEVKEENGDLETTSDQGIEENLRPQLGESETVEQSPKLEGDGDGNHNGETANGHNHELKIHNEVTTAETADSVQEDEKKPVPPAHINPASYTHRDLLLLTQMLHTKGLIEPSDVEGSKLLPEIGHAWFEHRATQISRRQGLFPIRRPLSGEDVSDLYRAMLEEFPTCNNTSDLANLFYFSRVKELEQKIDADRERFRELLSES